MTWEKEKIGFWCPSDIDVAIQDLIDRGVYQDKSKACVDLIRKGLKEGATISPELRKRLEKVAAFLDRTPEIVASQCIKEILDMLESESSMTPLILNEVKLRQARSKTGKPS